nr:SGNH hydrolase domain-containing protein [Ornithinimicrobium cryptoxanthini]
MSRLPTLALGLGAACTVLGVGAGLTLVRGMASSIEQAEAAPGASAMLGGDQPAVEPTGPGSGDVDVDVDVDGDGDGDGNGATASTAPNTSQGEGEGDRVPDLAATGPDLSRIDLTPESISPDPLLATKDVPALYARGCSGKLGETEVVRCVAGDPDGELVVALVGDSKIGQWGDVLEQLATEQGWALHLYTRSGCTWTAATIDDDGSCLQWGQRVHERLLGPEQPDVVIVSGVKHGAGEGTGQERRDRLSAGYVDYWSDLGRVGVPVIVLSDTPSPGEVSVYECVSEHRDDVSHCAFGRSDGSGTTALREAAARVATATFLTMNDWICPLEDCPPVIGDVLVYRQGSHITNTYAVSLLEPLRARLVPVVEEAVAASAASSR